MNRSVLIVDDSSIDRRLATSALERSGRFGEIWALEHGAEALALYQDYERQRSADPDRFPPLIVLLDLNMPVMSGFDFLDAYRELEIEHGEDEEHNIVILTSSESPTDVERAASTAQVSGYLVKPFTREMAEQLADRYLAA